VQTGKGGRPRLQRWPTVLSAQLVKHDERRRVVEIERRIVDGTLARGQTLRGRSPGDGVINTAYLERLNATWREHRAPLARRCRALARYTLRLQEGMVWVGTVDNFCTPQKRRGRRKKPSAGGLRRDGVTLWFAALNPEVHHMIEHLPVGQVLGRSRSMSK